MFTVTVPTGGPNPLTGSDLTCSLLRWLVDLGIVPPLVAHLTYKDDQLKLVAEAAWVLTYLAAT